MLESKFKTTLVREIKELFPGIFVIYTDPNQIQGFPDLLLLYKNVWAALEGKKYKGAKEQPNQRYYVNLLDDLSFARFIYPENREEVIQELIDYFEEG